MSFRLKLALAMMLLVAAGSITTLLIAQRRVEAYYERHFRAQFERQIAYFLALQEARLAKVKDECLKLSEKVRIVAALNEAEIPAEILYDVTDDELKALLGNLTEEARLPGVAPQRFIATFFRYLDSQGRPVSPPEGVRNRLGLPLSRRRLEQKLALIRGALDSPDRQQVGYLAFTLESARDIERQASQAPREPAETPALLSETNPPALQEVIVTKVLDHDNNRVLGALVLGFPLADLVPQPKSQRPTPQTNQVDSIQTGILLDDHFYANTNAVPESLASAAARDLSQRIKKTEKGQDDFEWRPEARPVGADIWRLTPSDTPYRVFYQLLNRESGFPPAYQVCLYSLAEARREQERLRWEILGSGSAALVGALVLGLFLSHGLSVPLRELARATGEVRQGNLNTRVRVRGRDEIGELAASFNEMTEGLAQKERYRTVLNQVADERVAQQLISGEIKLGGEVRQASVLFCDIRGFTALTENMPPAEVIEMLNEHMSALTRVVKQHNGVLDKFVGDLLMAIFGAPVSYGNDVFYAAQCALRLLQERAVLNERSRYKLQVGIGLATGKVVAGGMGSAERFHYTVLGERVNLGSRLCGLAGPGEILIDKTTADLLAGQAVTQTVSAVPIKGFATAVTVYKLVALKPQPATL
jgi:class 3 adenylate cyclase